MNQRIRELAEQADATVLGTMTGGKQYTFLEHDLEKFAELIVRECAELADESTSQPYDSYGEKIRKHLGIEE
jgi:hypothetical protein